MEKSRQDNFWQSEENLVRNLVGPIVAVILFAVCAQDAPAQSVRFRDMSAFVMFSPDYTNYLWKGAAYSRDACEQVVDLGKWVPIKIASSLRRSFGRVSIVGPAEAHASNGEDALYFRVDLISVTARLEVGWSDITGLASVAFNIVVSSADDELLKKHVSGVNRYRTLPGWDCESIKVDTMTALDRAFSESLEGALEELLLELPTSLTIERYIASLRVRSINELKKEAAVIRQLTSALSESQRVRALSLFKKGFEFFQEGEFDAAVAQFNSGLSIDPGDPRAHYYLGECYSRLKEEKSAIRHWGLTIELGGDTREAALAEGRLRSVLKR